MNPIYLQSESNQQCVSERDILAKQTFEENYKNFQVYLNSIKSKTIITNFNILKDVNDNQNVDIFLTNLRNFKDCNNLSRRKQ